MRRTPTLERVPMLRGRIVEANGIKAEDLKPAERSAWVLRGDRGITYCGDGTRRLAHRHRRLVAPPAMPERRRSRLKTKPPRI